MGRKNSSYSDRWNIARVLALVGALVTIVGYIMSIVGIISSNFDIIALLWQIFGVVISLLILIQTGAVKKRNHHRIPLNWWLLLIFVCLQAIFATGFGNFGGYEFTSFT